MVGGEFVDPPQQSAEFSFLSETWEILIVCPCSLCFHIFSLCVVGFAVMFHEDYLLADLKPIEKYLQGV